MKAMIAGTSLLLTTAVIAAPADTAPPQTQQAESDSGNNLEEIIITARRRSEALEDVPVTVTAVTSTELQKLNLQNLADLSGVVPGLQITPQPNRSLDVNTFRGVSFQPQSGTQNTLGFYVNDTFVANNFVTQSNFDIGQIELLSGPQGTLRGEPAPSGSLTITTRRPDLQQFGGYVTGTYSEFGSTNENGAVNLPIIQDKLSVRLAGLAEDDDLDGVHSINSSGHPLYHNYAGRASVRFEPIDSIEANLMYQHSYWRQDQFALLQGPGATGGVNPNAPANYNGPPLTPFQLLGVQTYPSITYNKSDIVTGSLDWHVLGQIVSYDGSYWNYANNNNDTALAANQVPGITAANPIPREASQFDTPSINQFTQTDELRIASETPFFGLMDYTAGLFYRRTTNEVNVVQLVGFLPGSFGTPAAPNDPFIYNPKYTLQLEVFSPAEEREHSEFVHFTFHLPSDTELTAGARHIDYAKAGSTQANLLPQGIFAGAVLPQSICSAINGGFGTTYPGVCDVPGLLAVGGKTTALPFTPQNLTDHAWIYNASLSHKFEGNLLTYVNVGSSWRPPGVAVGINNAANDPTLASLLHFNTEKSTQVETGFKWTFLENRARLNVALFHQKFTNFIYQTLPVLYLSDTGAGSPSVMPFQFTANPDAVVNGLDLETGIRLTHQWSFDLSADYTHGHLTGSEVPCSPPSGDQTKAAFPAGTHIFLCSSHASTSIAPNFNMTAQTEYDTPLPLLKGVDGFIRGLYIFYGRNPNASQFYVAPSYGLLNLYAGLRSPDGAWEGSFFAKNALDTKKLLSTTLGNPAVDVGNPSVSSVFGSSGYYNFLEITPRLEFGVTVTYSIGSR